MVRFNPTILEEEKKQEEQTELFTYICENTDVVLSPIEQMIYALNETQLRYGSIVILKNAP